MASLASLASVSGDVGNVVTAALAGAWPARVVPYHSDWSAAPANRHCTCHPSRDQASGRDVFATPKKMRSSVAERIRHEAPTMKDAEKPT